MMRMLLATGAALATMASAAKTKESCCKVRVSASGSHSFALYEIGEDSEQEHMHHVTEPGKMTRIDAQDHAEFVIRSLDMKFRAKIQVNKNQDPKTNKAHPFEFTFKNLMMEDEYQFELKHSNSGYVWILPNTKVTHMTDHSHRFDLRNKTHANIATVEIQDPKSEL